MHIFLLGDSLWKTLGSLCERIESTFRATHRFYECSHEIEYREIIERLSYVPAREWTHISWSNERQSELGQMFLDIHDAFQQWRHYIRHMGQLADVPIEPPEQTRLLDMTLQLPGVLCAGIPGGTTIYHEYGSLMRTIDEGDDEILRISTLFFFFSVLY
jgi:phosphomevalonate kinase